MDDLDVSSSLSESWSTIQRSIGFGSENPPVTSDGPEAERISDSIYLLHQPQSGVVEVEIIFFHGLQRGNYQIAHIDTWMSRSDPPVCWIRTWLVENFPRARILTVAYDSSVTRGSDRGRFDLHLAAESLAIEILTHAKVGKKWGTPVIMVGHCLGGLVIKQLCIHIVRKERESELDAYQAACKDFTYNLMGVFFFGTPHSGMNFTEGGEQLQGSSPLLKSLKALNKNTARLNEVFDIYRRLHAWETRAVGETSETQSSGCTEGLFQALMVNEGASRPNMDQILFTADDHFNICKPAGKTSASFLELDRFISDMLQKAKERNFTGLHVQKLPAELVGLEIPLGIVKKMLHPEEDRGGHDHVTGSGYLAVGIVGMGGIGKTTLARALFNDLSPRFEYSCFVDSVREIQNFTLDLLPKKYMYRHGRKIPEKSASSTEDMLRRKTFLLVLDDIGSREHVDIWYKELANRNAPGCINVARSRLVVTCRYQDLARHLHSSAALYNMPFLDVESSRQLLIKHSFPFPDPVPEELKEKVEEVAKKCDGLPLTLEVIGKYLRKKAKKRWDACLHDLDEASASDEPVEVSLWRKLRLSYVQLNEERQKMFLDAATIFNGLPFYQAKAAWTGDITSSDPGKLPEVVTTSWDHLVDMSLVYDVRDGDDTDIIRLHEQLRSLGRRIAKEDKDDLRVWDSRKAWDILTEDDDSSDLYVKVVGLRFNFSELPYEKRQHIEDYSEYSDHYSVNRSGTVVTITFPGSVFWRMKKLKYLLLKDVDVEETVQGNRFTNKLVMLIWSSGGTYSDLPVSCKGGDSKLAVLHLHCPSLKCLPESIGRHGDLRILELMSAKQLHKLPDRLVAVKNLERLSLSLCPRLTLMPQSFKGLRQLTHLLVKDCPELKTFPHLATLPNLKCLSFYSCKNLEELPDCSGSLSCLESLDLHRCLNLASFPSSHGKLPKLKSLRISGKFQKLPENFGQDFRALKYLQLQYCKNLLSLPYSTFSTCTNIEQLKILRCRRLQELPDPECFSRLERLRNVRIGWVALSSSLLLQEYRSRLPGHKCGDKSHFDFRVIGNKTYDPAESSSMLGSLSEDEELNAVSGDDEAFKKGDSSLQILRILDSASASTLGRSKVETREYVKGENLNYCYLTLECVHDDVQHIIVKVESHDQGFSSYEFAHGTDIFGECNIDLSVLNPEREEVVHTRRQIIENLHAVRDWQDHTYVMRDRSFLDHIKPGYFVALWLRSRHPEWVNYARYGSIEIVPRGEDVPHATTSDTPLYFLSRSIDHLFDFVSAWNWMKRPYWQIPWLGNQLEKIYVEVDSHDQGFSREQIRQLQHLDFELHQEGGKTWAELGIKSRDGEDVGPTIPVGTDMYAVRGWQRHSVIVEDESFFRALEEECSIVLYLRSAGIGSHMYARYRRIDLIPKQKDDSTTTGFSSQDSDAMFPYGDYIVETDERLQRGRSLNYMYLAYQNPFSALQQINIVAEAHDYGIIYQGELSRFPKYPTWGEVGVLGLDGEEIDGRVTVYINNDRHQDMSWQRHCYKFDHPQFLSRIKVGYKVVLWLRSGPGSSDSEFSVHCARYASIELVPKLEETDPPSPKSHAKRKWIDSESAIADRVVRAR